MKHGFFKKTCLMIIVVTSACSASTSVFAWGQTGHRVTGAIASFYLSPVAKAEIAKLLPEESLAEVSTYADEMRSHPSEFWQKTASPWHYVTVPKNKAYDDVGAPARGDALTALAKFKRDLLSDDTSFEQKQLALKFIVHLVGDLHQPLHAGDGTDRGGNDLKVLFFWEGSNLHRVWDSGLIDRQQLSYTEWTHWLQRKISDEDIARWNSVRPEDWVAESAAIRDTIYPDPSTNGEMVSINWEYQYQHISTVKRRLQMAGVRLALYLNQAFDKAK